MKSIVSVGSKLKIVCVIVGLGLSLSACAGSTCAGWGPIYVSPKDKLTEGTASSILKHDEYGAALKCPAFKPKGGWL